MGDAYETTFIAKNVMDVVTDDNGAIYAGLEANKRYVLVELPDDGPVEPEGLRGGENDDRMIQDFPIPAGTHVHVLKDDGSIVNTRTRGPIRVLGEDRVIIFLEGISGGYSLHRVTMGWVNRSHA